MQTPETFLPTVDFLQKYRELRHSDRTLRMAKSGMSSFTVIEDNERYINIDACRLFHNPIYDEHEVMLPGKAARTHLKFFCEPVGWLDRRQFNLRLSAPIYFVGKYLNRKLIYFDIKSCYYQLYRVLWLDVRFPRGRGTIKLDVVADRLAGWKQARNAVPGISYSNRVVIAQGKKRQERYSGNDFYNPALWYTLNYALHELSNLALYHGCCYIATDGFMFPAAADWQRFRDALDQLELRYEFISGVGDIYGWQSYRIFGYDASGQRASKITLPLVHRILDNPVDLIPDSEIRRVMRGITLKQDKILKLNLHELSDCGILMWWKKIFDEVQNGHK
jgi:hypothetical protein